MIDLKQKPTLFGTKVILRPFNKTDLSSLEEILNDKEVITLTGSNDHLDLEIVRQWYLTRNEQKDRLDLALVDKELDELVGEVVINEYNKENHSMNFRILIGANGRNRGLGTEATRLICDYIFEHTNLKALTLNVFAFNPRAQYVYEKVGFLVDSVDKNALEFNDEKIDSINMKLTRGNWEKLLREDCDEK